MIKRETIEEVRAAANIAEVIGGYLPLKKVGKYYRGVCPFHPDKSPSFYVSPERQVYHCFGCGAGGSVISFVMQFEKVDFPEAVRILAKRVNIQVQVEHVSTKYQPLYDACEFAARFFTRQLAKYTVAVNYFLKRGMKDETAQRYRLGYAPGGNTLRAEAKKEGFSEEQLIKAGLLAQREHGVSDWFFSRVIFPIMSLSGRVVGFSGRVLDDSEPKYLNSSESEIFHKGEALYGLFQAKNHLRGEATILVEGNFDLLALVNRGILNVVAPLGTAFTSEQALLLKRFNRQVRILFDADSAGRNATRRALEVLFREGLEPSIVSLPDDYDPDEYVREFGREKLVERIEQPIDLVAFLTSLRAGTTVAEKNALLRELIQLVGLIPDEVLQELFLNRISEQFQVAKEVLAVRVKQAVPTPKAVPPGTPVPSAAPSKISREEKLLALAAVNEELARIARELLPPEIFGDAVLQDLAGRLYAQVGMPDFGLASLTDQVTDENLKRRVAAWEFSVADQPSASEFTRLAQHLRSRWLCRAITAAEEKNDAAAAQGLRDEHFELRRKLLQKEP